VAATADAGDDGSDDDRTATTTVTVANAADEWAVTTPGPFLALSAVPPLPLSS